MNATRRFAAWCERRGINELAAVEPSHIAAFIKQLESQFAPPTVKQHLAVLRMLFDWLVIGHVIEVNPAYAVRGPKYVVKKGKTRVLTADEARELLDSIPITRNTGRGGKAASHEPSLVGLRDRALIPVMVYSFARINAVLDMKVRDYFVQGRRGWVRLHEKGGKEHEVPVITILKSTSVNILRRPASPAPQTVLCFAPLTGKTGELTRNAMWQQDAYRMIQRRAGRQLASLVFSRDDKVLLLRCDIVPRPIIGERHGGDATGGQKIVVFCQREAAAHERILSSWPIRATSRGGCDPDAYTPAGWQYDRAPPSR
jgi:site-specific recombinase XerD